jgi:hypothetical protein
VLLTLEALVCFAPVVFAIADTSVGIVTQIRKSHVGGVSLRHLPMLLMMLGFLTATFYMLTFVVAGRRIIPRSLMLIFLVAGTAFAGWWTFQLIRFDALPALVWYAPPFLCGLHLLYLGRMYFVRSANA